MTRLLYIVSHPIQYQAPLLRRVATEPGIELRVLFERIHPDHQYFDTGFGRDVKWDIDLTDGYDYTSTSKANTAEEIRKADVVWLHGWQSPVMKTALSLAKQVGRPVLMRGENCDLAMPDGPGLPGWLKRIYIARIFRRCSLFLAIGSANRQYYLSRGVPADRIVDMPYAVDNDVFAERSALARMDRSALRARLGVPPTRKIVLFAGKLQRRKKPDLLAAALSDAVWNGDPPALLFVGDGELRADLERLAPDAIFTGFVNQTELPAYYDLADIFVLPSLREPWGLAVNEAMACGTAVIVSDQVGCAADLVDRQTGRVVPADDLTALTWALVDCLDRSEDMGKAARKKITRWGFNEDIAGLKTALAKTADLP